MGPPPSSLQSRIVEAARRQIGTRYDASYARIPYPGGDVPRDRGTCTDVVIRSLRSVGCDMQRLIHRDMLRRRSAYPRGQGPPTDTNIDHRRVPNQLCFFSRFGTWLPLAVSPDTLEQWQPGDIVYWKLSSGLDHCGVLTDGRDPSGIPSVVHNLAVCAEENCLTRWKIVGHFRYPTADRPRVPD